ncbi:hypothetical protein PIB30_078548 [Stylosanthes scabra]|uniref:Uncharacterized protein n=1 Tax=Stylosanthes scabra TaxID=79078 RepID=A0ABU6TS77_9FABA|nr:hypothetical protein [Stylosanthes scabra]
MLRSNSDPDLLVFDPEIERSLRHIRQVKRHIQFEILSTSTMGDLLRITLKQMGRASMAMENQLVGFPELNENF